jgi:hypothetical protein
MAVRPDGPGLAAVPVLSLVARGPASGLAAVEWVEPARAAPNPAEEAVDLSVRHVRLRFPKTFPFSGKAFDRDSGRAAQRRVRSLCLPSFQQRLNRTATCRLIGGHGNHFQWNSEWYLRIG